MFSVYNSVLLVPPAHQPGSAYSVPGSSASSGSRRGKTRQYRTLSHTSNVDEALFGQSNTQKMRQQMLEDRWANGGAPIEREAQQRRNNRSGKSKKETVQVITKDLIRSLMSVMCCKNVTLLPEMSQIATH